MNTYELVFDQTAIASDYSIIEELGTLRVTPVPEPGPGPGPGPGPDPGDDPDIDIHRIVDSKAPLGNQILDTYCCILHLLIMLVALIILIAYTHDMKKRQKRIFELQEELDQITHGEVE